MFQRVPVCWWPTLGRHSKKPGRPGFSVMQTLVFRHYWCGTDPFKLFLRPRPCPPDNCFWCFTLHTRVSCQPSEPLRPVHRCLVALGGEALVSPYLATRWSDYTNPHNIGQYVFA